MAAARDVATAEFNAWCQGLALYSQAARPALPAPPRIIWQEGTTVLRDYAGGYDPTAPLVIAVPSLVNRAGIMDLLPGKSLLRHLAAGARVWLLDWQAPGEIEQAFTVDDYIARLGRVITRAQATGRPVYLLGYCMGGLLALAAAQLAQQTQPVDGLITLATPWDFNGYAPGTRLGIAQWQLALTPWLASGQAVPVDILQALFALLQPLATYEKFRSLGLKATIDDLFVAVEDWLNDGVPLTAAVAQTCFGDWFGRNATASGQWQVQGEIVDPAQLQCRSLIVAPQQDRLVPQASAAPLAAALPQSTLLQPDLGHVGMIVGRQARSAVWEPVAAWLKQG